MKRYEIYKDISTRTGGDIYIGVVGPVRVGKSTFIKSFMEKLVIPNINDEYIKERAIDELPQSASGKTIMTTEPKFIPNESIEITLKDNLKFKTRLVDCVGYLVDGALGSTEDGNERLVNTPWNIEQIPFSKAAEIGTKKVITEHSTLGILVTTDGSITDIPREDYEKAEKRVVLELKEINKPFTIVLNSKHPNDSKTIELANRLEKEYQTSVITKDVSNLEENDIIEIFSRVLEEFPINEIGFKLPTWFSSLPIENNLKSRVIESIKSNSLSLENIREIKDFNNKISSELNDIVSNINILENSLETGNVRINLEIKKELFYKILSDFSSFDIKEDFDIFTLLKEYSENKNKFQKIANALEETEIKGYGIITPDIDKLKLEEPEIVKNGNKFGVKLKASAPSIHMIRADIKTEVSPIVGSEQQSEELVKYLLSEFENDPKKIWNSNIFGKSLHELVNEGLQNKLYKMPDDAQMKLQETLSKIINEGSGGLICIIL